MSVVRNDIAANRTFPWLLRGIGAAAVAGNRPLSQEAKNSMKEFVTRYDDLVDLLCWSAKEGPSDRKQLLYGELRTWFVSNYEPVRSLVTRHLDSLPEDREPIETGTPTPRDAFESLFLPPKLETLIQSDAVIQRIQRTRCAVERCREELERDCFQAD